MNRSRLPEALIAIALLLALACAGLAIHAGEQRAQSWGPRALARALDGNIWLIVDRQLLIAGPEGELRQQVDLAQLGLRGPVNSLVPLPDGGDGTRVMAGIIDSPEWLVLDGEGRVADRYRPEGAGAAIHHTFHLGVAADGKVAMATSGDHRVLLFDPKGKRLTESPAGLFRYANGIWHEDGAWWVVDTNHGRVQRLAGQTLKPETSIPVPAIGGARFPALARRSPSGAITLTEMHNGMAKGVVIDVSADGTLLRQYPSQARDPEPVDLLWLDDNLLVADRSDYSLQLFDGQGRFLRNWGGEQVGAVMKASFDERQRWSATLLQARIGTVTLGLLAILGYFAWKQRPAPGGQGKAVSATLATPGLTSKDELIAGLRLYWPVAAAVLLLVVVMESIKALAGPLAASLKFSIAPVWTVVNLSLAPLLLMLPLMLLIGRRLADKTRLPEFEALLSARWVRWFQHCATAQAALEKNESAREVLMVQTSKLFPAFNMNVWLLTDRRLLIFRPGPGKDGKLLTAIPRRDCSATIEAATGWRKHFGGRDTIRLDIRDGRRFSGYAASPVTAQRIAALIGNARGLGTTWSRTSTAPDMRSPEPATAFVLSLLVPGSAHFMQDRFQLGVLLLSVAAILTVLLLGPVLLGWLGHYYDVPLPTGVLALSISALWALMAAGDATLYARKAHRRG
ncbi:MAG: hypothetical protein HZC22_08735 [Rhodocyclales bacterium]|nr:hypothetical protein [Rhodocyclales bacterium]